MTTQYESFFMIICFLLGTFVIYKIFIMFWQRNMIEGLENQQASTVSSGLAESSGANLAATKKLVEALENKVLLTNASYNVNYSDKCSALYDAVNYMMVELVANMDITNEGQIYAHLTMLNTLHQSKQAINDTLKFIDATETTSQK
jgi:hypothetical protein